MKVVVKSNQQLAHDGKVFEAGAVVDLRPDIAYEVRHLVDAVGEKGEVLTITNRAQAPVGDLDRELATAQDHERISILEAHRARVAAELERIDAQIAAEQPKKSHKGESHSTKSHAKGGQ